MHVSKNTPLNETLIEMGQNEIAPQWTTAPTLEVHNIFDPTSEQLLDGMYQMVRYIGRGGMGGVLLAHDQKLDRDVAVKYILPCLMGDSEIKARFFDEAKAMARICHENVARIYAIGEVAGSPYFVMEYIPGSTLSAHLRETQRLDMSEAMHILEQLCNALDVIHDAGLVHGDVKPGNVLLTSRLRVVLTDFGLSRVLEMDLTSKRGVLGTPAYMCPELADEPSSGPAGDIYSLAVVAYELLTGSLPFQGKNAIDFMVQHAVQVPMHPSEREPAIPLAVGDAIMHGLRKRPQDRPATAGAFFNELVSASRCAEASGPNHDLRFVIADDDDALRELVATTLEFSFPGAKIHAVSDGESALQAIVENPPTCALLDLQMPGLNGIELTASIRADVNNHDIQLMIMTAVGSAHDWRVLSSLGANAFVVKPFDPMELVERVRRLVEPA